MKGIEKKNASHTHVYLKVRVILSLFYIIFQCHFYKHKWIQSKSRTHIQTKLWLRYMKTGMTHCGRFSVSFICYFINTNTTTTFIRFNKIQKPKTNNWRYIKTNKNYGDELLHKYMDNKECWWNNIFDAHMGFRIILSFPHFFFFLVNSVQYHFLLVFSTTVFVFDGVNFVLMHPNM